jgi:predicted DNA-binding WGR domain protein
MSVYLERRDPTRNLARFYAVSIEPTLFNEWSVVCRWGRIGSHGGQRRIETFVSADAARSAAHTITTRKQRRGYR